MQIVYGDERKNEFNRISFPMYAKTAMIQIARDHGPLEKKGEHKIENITWRPRPGDPEIATRAPSPRFTDTDSLFYMIHFYQSQ